ncbi:MAG: hypothetical protein ABJE66_26305 [Deltaproteobacteria bacterium]
MKAPAYLAPCTKLAMIRGVIGRGARPTAGTMMSIIRRACGLQSEVMALFIIAGTLVISGCKGDGPKPDPSGGSGQLSGKDKDVRDALVLDAALTKAKKELAALESAQSRDEDAIAKKRTAIDAVEQTLATLRKRLDAPGARSSPP